MVKVVEVEMVVDEMVVVAVKEMIFFLNEY